MRTWNRLRSRGRTTTPLQVALAAFAATDEPELRQAHLNIGYDGTVTVRMHRHQWPAVAAMLDRLDLPRQEVRVTHLHGDRYVTHFRRVDERGRRLRGAVELSWFHEWR